MLTITRLVARQFRAVLRRCLPPGRPRGLAPPILVEQADNRLTVYAQAGEVGLRWQADAPGPGDGRDGIPLMLFEELEGSSDTLVTLEAESAERGCARWEEEGVARQVRFDRITDAQLPVVPELPTETTALPQSFLIALHEAGRAASRDATKYRLDRIQVQGNKGKLVASDARSALIQEGFFFPFTETLLIPAVPAFGSRELAGAKEVHVGRTATQLTMTAGPWTFFLLIDTQGRFPPVEDIVPRRPLPTRLELSDGDAVMLAGALRAAGAAEDGLVTLHLGERVTATLGMPERDATEVALRGAAVQGPPVRLALDPKPLGRALALGLRRFEVSSAGKPIVARAEGVTFLVMSLPPDMKSLPATSASQSGPAAPVSEPQPMPERSPAMSGRETNGRGEPAPPEAIDLLAEAEGLQTALREALAHACRLAAALKLRRRQGRAVEAALANLRRLGELSP